MCRHDITIVHFNAINGEELIASELWYSQRCIYLPQATDNSFNNMITYPILVPTVTNS